MAVKSRLLQEALKQEYEYELPVSMIDVVFLLLIFFLLASKFRKPERKMDVNLPTDTGIRAIPQQVQPPREVRIVVAQNGSFRLDQSPVPNFDDLVNRLRRIRAANERVDIVIVGEHKTPFKFIIQALDACMIANIFDVKFQGMDVRGLGAAADAPVK